MQKARDAKGLLVPQHRRHFNTDELLKIKPCSNISRQTESPNENVPYLKQLECKVLDQVRPCQVQLLIQMSPLSS